MSLEIMFRDVLHKQLPRNKGNRRRLHAGNINKKPFLDYKNNTFKKGQKSQFF